MINSLFGIDDETYKTCESDSGKDRGGNNNIDEAQRLINRLFGIEEGASTTQKKPETQVSTNKEQPKVLYGGQGRINAVCGADDKTFRTYGRK